MDSTSFLSTRLFNLLKNDQVPQMSKKNKKILYDILKKEFEPAGSTSDMSAKVKTARASRATQPAVTAESKSYKVWGKNESK